MMTSFGIWMTGELFEAIVGGYEFTENIEYISHGVKTGFGVFLIARFFWIRKIVHLEAET
jgi:hypothetical protein